MRINVVVLPGDGIGPEVTREAVRVLRAVADLYEHEIEFREMLIGGAAIRAGKPALPRETLDACLSGDAVLLGAVGSPEFDAQRPETALLELRRALGGFANLRPVIAHRALLDCSPLRAEKIAGADILVVRELLGGLYFGEPRGATSEEAFNTMRYSASEIERVARVAFDAARKRRRRVTSVDKANVLETSRLWREVVSRVAADYCDVVLDHLYIDACAMLLISDPLRFDVILTENLFGDILSDEAAVISGSLGMLASATVGGAVDLYEPVHGSAPDLAGRGIANPLGAMATAALLLRHSAGLDAEAHAIESAIARVLDSGCRTRDLGGNATTEEIATRVIDAIRPPRTLVGKVFDAHVVREPDDSPPLLYIDLHLLHEVTSPQAFDGLRAADRRVRRPDLTVATVDHNVPTSGRADGVSDPLSALQIETLRRNCSENGITLHDIDSTEQGIVHVIGPELGLTRPGMTIVCGDSHTSTHGAFGALAFGIGTTEVEHVLATQCLPWARPRTMNIRVDGRLAEGVTAKDLALAIIRGIGTDGAAGHVIEYSGEAIRALSMEGRMTLCNMSIESGARAGMIAPDETTFAYLRERGVTRCQALRSDHGARFDRTFALDARDVKPQVSWGTTPAMTAAIDERIPEPLDATARRALDYMSLAPGTPIDEIAIDRVFIGSCTNGRLEDLRAAARVVRGYRVQRGVRAMAVPGSQAVKRAAEAEGIDRILRDAGFEWCDSGCSMCLGMNADVLAPGERCASTSNRNFEGRQGRGGRTHLVSPAMAAAAAIAGRFTDVRHWRYRS